MKKKITGLLVLIILFVSMTGLIIANGKYIFRSEPYYSATEVIKKEQEAYDKGVDENSSFSLRQQIINLTAQLNETVDEKEKCDDEIVVLNSKVSSLELLKKTNEEKIAELEADVSSKENTISENNATIADLNAQVEDLSSKRDSLRLQIGLLNNQITSLQNEIKELEADVSSKDNTISENNETIANLKKTISIKEQTIENYRETVTAKNDKITTLNNQISTLQNTITQLQTTNDMNVETIASLNAQIVNLNTQISELSSLTQTSSSQISALNSKINELQASINYYETYIANLESDNQVVATFEYDGSVINIQIIKKGSTVSIVAPEDTAYKIFNGWKVEDEAVDLSTYTVSTNTKFVADITYKYDVVFKVNDTTIDSQIVEKETYATIPSNPSVTGYYFDGWTINGVDIVDVSTYKITATTTFIAKLTKKHTVKFVYDGTTRKTQYVRNNEYATAPTISDTEYKVLNGWKVNDTIVDVETYQIVTDTTFTADITYYYDVVVKAYNGVTLESAVVKENTYYILPSSDWQVNTLTHTFFGWTTTYGDTKNYISANGNLSYKITKNTVFYSVTKEILTVTIKSSDSILATGTEIKVYSGETMAWGDIPEESEDFVGYTLTYEGADFIDIYTYVFTKNTVLYRNTVYRYEVKFMVDGEEFASKIVEKGEYVTFSKASYPTKEGYKCVGWSLNGVDVIDSYNWAGAFKYKITEATTFIAVFEEETEEPTEETTEEQTEDTSES